VFRTELSSVKESLILEKQISRSSEKGLAQLKYTYDIYKEEMEKSQSEKEVKIEEAVSELAESQEKMDNDVRAWDAERKKYEAQVTELKLHEVEVLCIGY
jgi:peptidoglycan hydrolase CwlO-like protein